MRTADTISRRKLPNSDLELSSLSIAIDPTPDPRATCDALAVASLRRAWEAGVTTFDLSSARFPERAELLFATAFPDPDPGRIAILRAEGNRHGRGAHGPTAGVRSESLASELSDSLRESRRRMRLGTPPVVVWWPSDADGAGLGAGSRVLERLQRTGELRAWATGLRSGSPLPPSDSLSTGSNLLVGPLSLVDRSLVPAFEQRSREGPVGLVATDPFAGGLLDGSRISRSLGDRSIGAGPTQLRTLEEEFAPILALAFLTSGKKRTLYEAALLYTLHWSWVTTVAVPLPAPERLARLLAVERLPPLSGEELERLSR
jgi:aryl-alcohol dehydrogenase-like predicted oxidoreductase